MCLSDVFFEVNWWGYLNTRGNFFFFFFKGGEGKEVQRKDREGGKKQIPNRFGYIYTIKYTVPWCTPSF